MTSSMGKSGSGLKSALLCTLPARKSRTGDNMRPEILSKTHCRLNPRTSAARFQSELRARRGCGTQVRRAQRRWYPDKVPFTILDRISGAEECLSGRELNGRIAPWWHLRARRRRAHRKGDPSTTTDKQTIRQI